MTLTNFDLYGISESTLNIKTNKSVFFYDYFQSCYLVTDYKDTLKRCEQDPENYRTTVYLNNFDLPQGATM